MIDFKNQKFKKKPVCFSTSDINNSRLSDRYFTYHRAVYCTSSSAVGSSLGQSTRAQHLQPSTYQSISEIKYKYNTSAAVHGTADPGYSSQRYVYSSICICVSNILRSIYIDTSSTDVSLLRQNVKMCRLYVRYEVLYSSSWFTTCRKM